jgi:hypothetical protein
MIEAVFLLAGLGAGILVGLWALVLVVQLSVAVLDWNWSLPFVWPLPAIGRFLKRLAKRFT